MGYGIYHIVRFVVLKLWKNWFKCKRHPDRLKLKVADSYHPNSYPSIQWGGPLSLFRSDNMSDYMAPNYHLWWDGFKYVKI